MRLLLPSLAALVAEIVVVDDGSVDQTRAVARRFGALVVERPRRLGIGSAIHAGVAHASQPYVVTLDADGSHPPARLVDAYARLADGYDVVRFSRFLRGSTWDAPIRRRAAVRTFAVLLRVACRIPLTDPTNGFMVARRACFAGPTRFGDDPGEGWVAEFLARNRTRPMIELPYAHAARRAGRSRFTALQELARAVRSVRFGMERTAPVRRA